MYGWSGIYGTTFWVDPKEELVAVMMVQRYPDSPAASVVLQRARVSGPDKSLATASR